VQKRVPSYAEPDTQMSQARPPSPPLKESDELRAEVVGAILSTGGVVIEKVPEKVKEITAPCVIRVILIRAILINCV
jgi:hypothetical protein